MMFFHRMKSFLLSSGIQESSAPSLVSVLSHEIEHIRSLRKFPFLLIRKLVHFDNSRKQLDQFVQCPNLSEPVGGGGEKKSQFIHQHSAQDTSPLWAKFGSKTRKEMWTRQLAKQAIWLILGPFDPGVREIPSEYLQMWTYSFIYILSTYHVPSIVLSAVDVVKSKTDMVSLFYWPLCSSSQLPLKKCPTCKSDITDDIFDHTLEQQHIQTLYLNCPICDKSFSAKEKQIFEDHVFCHTF